MLPTPGHSDRSWSCPPVRASPLVQVCGPPSRVAWGWAELGREGAITCVGGAGKIPGDSAHPAAHRAQLGSKAGPRVGRGGGRLAEHRLRCKCVSVCAPPHARGLSSDSSPRGRRGCAVCFGLCPARCLSPSVQGDCQEPAGDGTESAPSSCMPVTLPSLLIIAPVGFSGSTLSHDCPS